MIWTLADYKMSTLKQSVTVISDQWFGINAPIWREVVSCRGPRGRAHLKLLKGKRRLKAQIDNGQKYGMDKMVSQKFENIFLYF